MNHDQHVRGAYFRGQYPPDPRTFAGTVMIRVAAALDARDSLVTGFSAVAADMGRAFPGEQPLSPAQVAAVVDSVIADHNAQVSRPSAAAIALLDAIDELQAAGVAVAFGDGSDPGEALAAVGGIASRMDGQGISPVGYCYSDATDVAELITSGRLVLTYGVFAQSPLGPAQVGEQVVAILGRAGLAVSQHDTAHQRVVVDPLVYEVPYHGYELHHVSSGDVQPLPGHQAPAPYGSPPLSSAPPDEPDHRPEHDEPDRAARDLAEQLPEPADGPDSWSLPTGPDAPGPDAPGPNRGW